MKITSVNVHLVDNEGGRMKGIASVTLDDCFIIRGLRIIEGENKTFVAMPSRKDKNGESHDIVHPLNQETRTMFDGVVLEAYQKELENAKVEE